MNTYIKSALNQIKAEDDLVEKTEKYLRSTLLNKKDKEKVKFNIMNMFSIRKFAMAVCALILVCGVSIAGYAYYKTPVSYLSLDINPSVELGVNSMNNVISAKGFNVDGKNILDEQNIVDLSVKDAVKELVKSACEKGFIASDGSTIISVTSETKSPSAGTILEKDSEDGAKEALRLKGNIAVIYKYNVDISKRDLAIKRGITPGKLNIIQKLQDVDPTITIDQYKDVPVTEIIKKIEKIKKLDNTNSSSSKTTSDSTYSNVESKTPSVGSSSKSPISSKLSSSVVSKTTSFGVAPVNLGTAGNYAILAKSGISSVPNSVIIGDIAVSPIGSTAITGFSLILDATNVFSKSTQITGKSYAPDYASPTPSNLTKAVGDMETAFTDAAGRTADYTELYTGDISGKTLTPGVYKWGTGVLITSNVTLNGGPNDVFIFQIAKGITQAAGTRITLSGGAQAKNIFWQSCETVAIGTGAHFEGIILGKTNITLGTNASINGRLLAQTAVTLIKSTVVAP
jgi:hypothetical protein